MSEHADDSGTTAGETLTPLLASPVVHLELHTRDLRAACAFYSQLLQWRTEQVEHSSGCYQALEVGEIATATDRARRLGASVLLEPREGPAGWRSVISTPAAGEIALWQQKARRR